MDNGLLGVIIGCFLTWLFTVFTEKQRFNREKEFYFLKRKEETYIEMQELITDFIAKMSELKGTRVFPIDLRIKYNSIKAKAETFADEEVKEAFYDLINKEFMDCICDSKDYSYDKVSKFFELPKKSLGVK